MASAKMHANPHTTSGELARLVLRIGADCEDKDTISDDTGTTRATQLAGAQGALFRSSIAGNRYLLRNAGGLTGRCAN
jgi:hypothetical protein